MPAAAAAGYRAGVTKLDARRAFALALEDRRRRFYSATPTDERPPVAFHALYPPLGGPAWEVTAISTPETAGDWAIAVIVDDAAEAVAFRRLTRPGLPPEIPRRTLAEVVAVARAYVERHMRAATLPETGRQITYYASFEGIAGAAWEVVVQLPPSSFEGTGTDSILVSDCDGEVALIMGASGFPRAPLGRPRG